MICVSVYVISPFVSAYTSKGILAQKLNHCIKYIYIFFFFGVQTQQSHEINHNEILRDTPPLLGGALTFIFKLREILQFKYNSSVSISS